MVVYYILFEYLATFIALYVAFTFFDSTTSSFHIVSKNFLETELEALSEKEIITLFPTYYFSNFRWFHLHSSSVGHNWYSTQLLQLKTDRGTHLVL